MYQRMKTYCPTKNRASGPGTDPEIFFTTPGLQEECMEYLNMVPRNEYSCYVSDLLDQLGYRYDMIKYRQQMFDEMNILYNRHRTPHYNQVTTGGKGEGTATYFESDVDYMKVVKDVICTDYPHRFIHEENITLFQTERQETSPGYTRLKLLKFEGTVFVDVMKHSLIESGAGSHYLSSQLLTDLMKAKFDSFGAGLLASGVTTENTSGPSIPNSNKYIISDNVYCFKCVCPDILERWVSRRRRHGWPSPDTIHDISLLDGHVVPVGMKESKNMYIEWRVCYSLAELHLMRTLNETQVKVYILLKKISKSVLNPVCKDMTSYIMKNVVFWMCEANGVDRFKRDLLMDRLYDCIKYLRTCVSENNLPSYMIPERNLLAGRLDIHQRKQLTSLLGDLLSEGGGLFLRFDMLREAMIVMYRTPCMLREFGEKRDKVEQLLLIMDRCRTELWRPGMSLDVYAEETDRLLCQNELYVDTQIHVNMLIHFNKRPLRELGKTDEEIDDFWHTRLMQLLS